MTKKCATYYGVYPSVSVYLRVSSVGEHAVLRQRIPRSSHPREQAEAGQTSTATPVSIATRPHPRGCASSEPRARKSPVPLCAKPLLAPGVKGGSCHRCIAFSPPPSASVRQRRMCRRRDPRRCGRPSSPVVRGTVEVCRCPAGFRFEQCMQPPAASHSHSQRPPHLQVRPAGTIDNEEKRSIPCIHATTQMERIINKATAAGCPVKAAR